MRTNARAPSTTLAAAALTLAALAVVFGGCFFDYTSSCERNVDLNCYWTCGNGQIDDGEACDDGNTADCDGCRGDCSAEETGCGDGFICAKEQCDDGNADAGDGCSECKCELGDFPPGMSQVFGYPETAHCYARVNASAGSWAPARDKCLAWGGDLVAFSSDDELTAVTLALPGNLAVWTGGTDMEKPGTFAWTNGEPWLEDPLWAEGEPNDIGKGAPVCVAINNGGELVDQDCVGIAAFICERDVSAP